VGEQSNDENIANDDSKTTFRGEEGVLFVHKASSAKSVFCESEGAEREPIIRYAVFELFGTHYSRCSIEEGKTLESFLILDIFVSLPGSSKYSTSTVL
jgi:hypothetical protein